MDRDRAAYRHPACVADSLAALDSGCIVSKLAAVSVDSRRRFGVVAVGGGLRQITCTLQRQSDEQHFTDDGTVWNHANAFESLAVTRLCAAPLPDPVQSVAIQRSEGNDAVSVVATDTRGRVLLVPDIDCSESGAAAEDGLDRSVVVGDPCAPSDAGHAAVAVTSIPGQLAACHFFSRSVTIFKNGRPVRKCVSLAPPVAIEHMPTLGNECYGVCGSNTMGVFDARSQEPLTGSLSQEGNLLALSAMGNRIAVTGTERIVNVYDVRKLTTSIGAWGGATKYETSFVKLRDQGGGLVAASSTDSELAVGAMTKGKACSAGDRMRIRGDGRWVGLDYLRENGGELIGMSAHGSLYVITGVGASQLPSPL